MKLIILFLAIFNLQALANVYSQQKVSINLKSADFKKVITAIQKQTNYHFVFSERKIPAKNVSINVQNENVTTVLDQLLANTDFTYTQLDNNLIVITGKNDVVVNKVVTGKVVDDKGLPLPGVSIKVKGSGTGTVSDVNGGFSINVADDAVLVVSFIGYETQEVPVAGKSSINITMQSSSKNLNEVVVTALGIKKDERKLGYSVTTVGGDELNKAKETNVAMSLEGRVAGLQVSGTNGGPGSSARILLRGVSSLTAAGSPLFVINGVPMDNTQRGSSSEWGGADYGDGISNLNPDDIESMTVLKGQSASALYGSRAANGVILITTKGGKKNSNFGVEYNTNLQYDQAIHSEDFQQVYGQGQLGQKPVSVTDALNSGSLAWGAKLDGSSVIQFDGKSYPYSAVNNNIYSFYNTGRTFTNTVAFTGGSANGSYRLSLSNVNNTGIVPNSGLDRKSINFNTTQTVIPKLDVTVIANYIDDSEKNRTSLSDGPGNPNNVLFLAPNEDQKILAPGYGANGVETQFTNDNYVTNPYFAAYNFSSSTYRQRLISSMSGKYNFTDWAYAQLRMGYDNINDKRVDITPTGTGYNSQGNMDQINGRILELNYDALIGIKHDLIKNWVNLDFSGGASIRKHIDDGTSINSGGTNFIIPYYYAISNLPSHPGSVNYDKLQTNSAYYTADFAIKDFLVLSTTGRYDTYSTLPDANRGIFSPSVSGSFIFSDLYHMNGVDFGKIRLSYAQTSGDAGQAYRDAIYYTLNNTINGIPAAGFSSTLPNLTLKPYTLRELEGGIEMKFWGDRLGFDLAVFHRKTRNEILPANLDPSTGYSNYYVGTGSDQNNGIEIELHGTPVKTADFSWTPAFNFTYVKNKVLQTDLADNNLGGGNFRPLNGAVTQYVVGLPGPQVMAADYLRNASGQIIYDASGLPEKTALKPMGSTVPKIYGGFNNSFNYKKFNLSFLIDYRYGNKILSSTAYYSIYRGENKLTLPGRETGVTGVGVTESGAANTTNVPAQTYYQALAQRISSYDVLDGSFIKLRQVTFGYTIGGTTLQHTPFSAINVSLVGRNLWTIMKRSDNIDPESGFSSTVAYAGIEGTSLPAVRTFGFNVNFKFKN
ncbi:MAG: SusC/RagA family TonB-linked outer membrane protein [Bacteroidetes bacterium]|jgi:TonB-linked SusC/RagA family outer membrane protein|nr:SusC/RagA family TonB-linked outer membrane protein [Bacteroidota bacterium]